MPNNSKQWEFLEQELKEAIENKRIELAKAHFETIGNPNIEEHKEIKRIKIEKEALDLLNELMFDILNIKKKGE